MFQIHEEGYDHDQTSSEEKIDQDEKFEDSFKASMDQLNETYAKKIEKLVSDLKSLSDTIDINTKDNELKQNNHYNNVKTMLESLLIEIKEKIDSYKFPSEEIINELTNLKNDVNSLTIHTSIYY